MTRSIAACLMLTFSSAMSLGGETNNGTIEKPAVAQRPAGSSMPAISLRYRFQTNQVVSYLAQHQSTITELKGGRKRTTRNETTTRKHFTVIAALPDGTAILETVLDHVKMSVRFNKQKPRTYDSKIDKEPPNGFKAVAKTIGRALVRIKVDANGGLVSSVPLLSSRVQSKVVPYKGPAKPANDPSKNFLVVFPKKPVRVGESWSDRLLKPRLRVSAGGRGLYQEFPIIRNYRLDSVKGDLATIRIEAVSLRPLHEVGLQVQAAQLLPSITVVFDVRRGLIVSRTSLTNSKVIGADGAGSLLHTVSKRVETLAPKRTAAAKSAKKRD